MENIGSMFEQASRLKLRFDSPRGGLSTEDLWDLPLSSASGNRANLDEIAIGLSLAVRDTADVKSFVTPAATDAAKSELALKFDLVKYVIGVRITERDAKAEAVARREKKQRILELIAQKQDEALGAKSEAELLELANSL